MIEQRAETELSVPALVRKVQDYLNHIPIGQAG